MPPIAEIVGFIVEAVKIWVVEGWVEGGRGLGRRRSRVRSKEVEEAVARVQ